MVTRIIAEDNKRLFKLGDKRMIYDNVEDITSYRIFIVDDIYELSSKETLLVFSRIKFEYKGKISKFVN